MCACIVHCEVNGALCMYGDNSLESDLMCDRTGMLQRERNAHGDQRSKLTDESTTARDHVRFTMLKNRKQNFGIKGSF